MLNHGISRVVVTGIGVLAANGSGVRAYWQSLLECRSGIALISQFDPAGYPVTVSGEISDFDFKSFVDYPLKLRRVGRHTQLALAALQLALEDAGLEITDLGRHQPLPISIGISTSSLETLARGKAMLDKHGPSKISPYVVTESHPGAVMGHIANFLEIETRPLTLSSACAAGLDAIGIGAAMIRCGEADVVIAGGADSPIGEFGFAIMANSGLASGDNGKAPEKMSCPFDRDRRGGIIAEGAAIFVLENAETARARGARIYAEVSGYGLSADVPGRESGTSLAVSMQMAVANARLHRDKIEYICAQAPSDLLLDRVETQAIKEVLRDAAYRTPVSSVRGVTGSPLAAAGPLGVAASALAIHKGVIPPTADYEHPDPECDLDYVPNEPRESAISNAIVNSHALGGGSNSLVLKSFNG